MATVKMPLLSGAASGTIADSLVYYKYRGINCVRQWTQGTDPLTPQQLAVRQKFALVSKLHGKVWKKTRVKPDGSWLYQCLQDATPSHRLWSSMFKSRLLPLLNNEYFFTSLSYSFYSDTQPPVTQPWWWSKRAGEIGVHAMLASHYPLYIDPGLQLFCYAFGAMLFEITDSTGNNLSYPNQWTEPQLDYFCTSFRQAKSP